jgi:two-component system NtrC family sensor kinase
MKNRKKTSRRTFGRSFEKAYMKIDDRKLLAKFSAGGNLEPSRKFRGFGSRKRNPSESQLLEEKLAQSEKLAGIGTLASGIANEINNPLAGIMGYAEIMMGEDDLVRMKKYAEKIVNEAERVSDIVKWLSRYSREAKDRNIEDVDLNEIISESLEAFKLTEKSCDVDVEKYFKNIPKIKGNRGELQQIFVNLLENAVDAMDKRGKLCLSTMMKNEGVEVRVSDDGIGIPNEDIKRVFEPFFSTKEVGKGTGLGLYVASMLVKKHHGKIDVDSKEGKGTTFTIRFPISEETEEEALKWLKE